MQLPLAPKSAGRVHTPARYLSINRFDGSFFILSNDCWHHRDTLFIARAATYPHNRCRLDVRLSVYLLASLGQHLVRRTFGFGLFAMLSS